MLTKEICGMRCTDFAKSELLTRIFPDKIKRTKALELQPAKSLNELSQTADYGLCDFYFWSVRWSSLPKFIKKFIY